MYNISKKERKDREKRQKEIRKTRENVEDLLADLETYVVLNENTEEIKKLKNKLLIQINKLSQL